MANTVSIKDPNIQKEYELYIREHGEISYSQDIADEMNSENLEEFVADESADPDQIFRDT